MSRLAYNRFSATMVGALMVFLGAATLANAGEVTAFVVQLVGFACAIFGAMIFIGDLLRAHSIDLVPFEELLGAGALVLAGAIMVLFPNQVARMFFSLLGMLIVLSGLGDLGKARSLAAEDDQLQRMTLRIGIVTVAVGVFVTVVPVVAVHVVPIVCGLALVLDGLSELYLALTMVDSGE